MYPLWRTMAEYDSRCANHVRTLVGGTGMDIADIEQLIREDGWMLQVLSAAQQLDFPDWMVGAGFVSNRVWDWLHGYADRTPLFDVDVIYFDPAHGDASLEGKYEAFLGARLPLPWSV